jgi:hypothetical protein
MVRLPDVTSTKVIVPTVLFAFLSPAVTGMGGLRGSTGNDLCVRYPVYNHSSWGNEVRGSAKRGLSRIRNVLSSERNDYRQDLIIRNTFLYWILFAVIRSQSPLEF